MNNIVERLRALSCSLNLAQDELDTVMAAIRAIEALRKDMRDNEREFQREARDISAQRGY